MQGSQSPDAFMVQRNTPYMGGTYDRMAAPPVYDNMMYPPHATTGSDHFGEGPLVSTSGSSSSASHHVMPWTHHPTGGRGNPSTPPRTSNHPNYPDSQNAASPQQQQQLGSMRVRNGMNPPVHYRTNFGKNCSYFPPATKSSPSRVPPDAPVGPRRDLPPSPKRLPPAVLENIARARSLIFEGGQAEPHEYGPHPEGGYAPLGSMGYGYSHGANGPTSSTWEEDDVPFDQQRDLYRPPSGNYPNVQHGSARNFDVSMEVHQETPPRASQSDWEQPSPDRPSPLRTTYYTEPDESVTGRFQISPPRVTDPKPLPQQSKAELDMMLMSMGHEAFVPSFPPGPTMNSPPGPSAQTQETTGYQAQGNRFFGRPVHGEPGYDSMEAECSPSRTQESTSLYSPFSQNTRGSQFKWPDDSPRSKNLDSPTSRHTASVHSPKSLHSARVEDPMYADDVGQLDEPVDMIPEDRAQYDPVNEFDEYESHHSEEYDDPEPPEPLTARRLPEAHYPSLVSVSHESDSQSNQISESAPSQDDRELTDLDDAEMGPGRIPSPSALRVSVERPLEVEGSWDDDVPDPEDELPTSSAADETTTPQSLRKKHSAQTDDDSIFVFTTDDDRQGKQQQQQLSPSKRGISPKQVPPRKKGQTPTQRRGRRRTTSESEGDDDEDDTSLENDYGGKSKRSSSLQERTQQAWKSRKSAVHRSQSIPAKPADEIPIPDPETSTAGQNTEEDEITALTGATGVSGGPSFGGSLNSLYSKTLESEVEDAIKDLLLIGTGRATHPGRRAIKFQPGKKRLLKEGLEDSSVQEDEATELTPLDDETEDMDDTIREEKKEAENPIQLMWEYMEGNLSVLGSAFGLSPEAKSESKSKQKTKEKSVSSADEGSSFTPKPKPVSRGRDRSSKKKKKSKSKARQDDNSGEIEYKTFTIKSHSHEFGDADKSKLSSQNTDKFDDADRSKLSSQNTDKRAQSSAPTDKRAQSSAPIFVPATAMEEEEEEEGVELDDSTAFGGSASLTYTYQAASVAESDADRGNDFPFDDPFFVSSEPMVPVSPTASAPSLATKASAAPSVATKASAAPSVATKAPSLTTTRASGPMPLSVSRNAKLEEDPRLIELALDAARSVHQLAGVEFDDSGGIDIVADVRFSIVKLALPLGILFQENNGGCWVTRILPSGNAAKVGGVELGDQLAAVNGVSAIKAKVDEVCTLVSESAEPSAVELTFLRYIGPLRALPIEPEEEEEEAELSVIEDDELKQSDHCQPHNVFSCVIGTVKDEPTAQTEPEEMSRPEEKPRKEFSELQPSITAQPVKQDARQKTEGKKRFRFFGIGRKKHSSAAK